MIVLFLMMLGFCCCFAFFFFFSFLKYPWVQGSHEHNPCTCTVLVCSKTTALSGQDRTCKEALQPTSSCIQVSQPSAPLSSFALPSTPSSTHSHPPKVPALAFNAPHPRTGLTPSTLVPGRPSPFQAQRTHTLCKRCS